VEIYRVIDPNYKYMEEIHIICISQEMIERDGGVNHI